MHRRCGGWKDAGISVHLRDTGYIASRQSIQIALQWSEIVRIKVEVTNVCNCEDSGSDGICGVDDFEAVGISAIRSVDFRVAAQILFQFC
jgi:hypothetical protein